MFIKDGLEEELHKGAVQKLNLAIDERLKQLKKIAGKMHESIEVQKSVSANPSEKMIMKKTEYAEKWPEIEEFLKGFLNVNDNSQERDVFSGIINNAISQTGNDYIAVIKRLDKEDSQKGTEWLQGIVDNINSKVWEFLPSF